MGRSRPSLTRRMARRSACRCMLVWRRSSSWRRWESEFRPFFQPPFLPSIFPPLLSPPVFLWVELWAVEKLVVRPGGGVSSRHGDDGSHGGRQQNRPTADQTPLFSPFLSSFFLCSFSGAFSNVYKAIDRMTGQKVAVKVVRKYELTSSQVSLSPLHSFQTVRRLRLRHSLRFCGRAPVLLRAFSSGSPGGGF